MRLLERVFRRAGLPLAMSEGFHPKPRMSFPSALALGIEGLDEVVEVELAEPIPAEQIMARLAAQAVPGLGFAAAEVLPPGVKKARLCGEVYQIPIPPDRCAATQQRIGRLVGPDAPGTAENPSAPPDLLRQSLEEIGLEQGVLRFRLRAGGPRSARPHHVLAALGLEDLLHAGTPLTRTRVLLHP